MTVRSVDLVTMAPRMTEASKVQQVDDQHPQVVQHAQSVQAQTRTERAQHQVTHKMPADQAAIEREGSSKGQGGRRNRASSNRPAEKKQPAPDEPGLGGRLDVKL